MYKNNILNLVLFIVVISLASVIYFSEEKTTELERLSATDIADIASITIQHNQNTTTIFKQKDNHWQISQPVSIAANDFRINSILKLINAPVHNKYSVDEMSLNSIGLDKPATSIKLNDKKIDFGITNPATNLRYVKLDNFVYTIEDVYYPLLSSSFGTLVSFDLLPKNSAIEKLILINQTISRDDKGLWKSNIDISADNINKTIDHWLHDQAFGVHEYMQRDSLGEVFIYIEDHQQPISYVITDTDPWLILARPEIGLEYHLDIEAYNNLITPQNE
ncbi:MAG: hypothetical protein BMS9Abin19_0296 [Gammaproteobacteria bacterium]|nr:MAG: hypothetical protein BMS9Abin19_0296 [Gammaproteobacteria bacterium]